MTKPSTATEQGNAPVNSGSIELQPKRTKETLLYRQGLDSQWRLRDARDFHIGTFASPAFIKQWCDDNGYRCRQG